MKSARFRLRPLAPWGTPWQADSLFGALCWEVARAAEEKSLGALLQRFRKGPPPFVISDAFPAEVLPRPLCATHAGWANAAYISREQFIAVRHGETPAAELPRQQWWAPLREMHARIPRDGADPVPFQTDSFTWLPEVPEAERYFSLYARAEEEWLPKLAVLLRALGRSGFGKRSATGRGAFELLGAAEPCDWLEPLPFENAFVSLSHFVPEDSDPADGWWNTLVKYPKMGSERAASSAPYKGRVVMLTPGSCFRPVGRPRRWYGRLLTGLSPAFPDALHYALAYAVGIRWDVK
jgi:CRISPR-associated protein Csm4